MDTFIPTSWHCLQNSSSLKWLHSCGVPGEPRRMCPHNTKIRSRNSPQPISTPLPPFLLFTNLGIFPHPKYLLRKKNRDRQGHTYSHSQPKDEIPNYHFVIFFHSWNPPPHSKRYHGRPDHRRRNHGHHHIIILSMRKPHPQSVMIVIRWELSRQWNWSFKMSTASLLCYTGFSSRAGYNTTQQHTGTK